MSDQNPNSVVTDLPPCLRFAGPEDAAIAAHSIVRALSMTTGGLCSRMALERDNLNTTADVMNADDVNQVSNGFAYLYQYLDTVIAQISKNEAVFPYEADEERKAAAE